MPKSENYSTTTVTDSKGKTSVKVSHTLSESSMKRSYHERYQMVDLLSLPTFIILFVLVVFASTILYFKNNIDTYMPDGNTYVQYTDQDLIDMQIEYPLSSLGNDSLSDWYSDTTNTLGTPLSSSQLVTNGDFSYGTTGWVQRIAVDTFTVTNNVANVIESSGNRGRIEHLFTVPSGSKVYYAFDMTIYSLSSGSIGFAIYNDNAIGVTVYQNTIGRHQKSGIYLDTIGIDRVLFLDSVNSTWNIDIRYVYVFNISTLITNKQYSPMFNTTFDLMTDANIKLQMDAWVQSGLSTVIYPGKVEIYPGIYAEPSAEQIVWMIDNDAYNLGALKVLNGFGEEVMKETYLEYQSIMNNNVEITMALGTIDPNTGRDFYHLDVSDYERLGNNIKSSFQGLSIMIKGMTNTIESIGNFLAKVGGTIQNFYDEAYEFMSGETIDEVWTKAQNIWLWITGKGWAVKQP